MLFTFVIITILTFSFVIFIRNLNIKLHTYKNLVIVQTRFNFGHKIIYIFFFKKASNLIQNKFKSVWSEKLVTLDFEINIGIRLLIFRFFPGATSLLKRAIHKKKSEIMLLDEVGYVSSRSNFYCFSQIFQGLRLFRSLE